MALRPGPDGLVPRVLFVQLVPQILIRHRLLPTRAPAVHLPLMNPLRDAVLQVIRIGHDFDGALLFQRPQALYRGLQLHPIVGSLRLRAVHLARLIAITEDARPAARARIADAGSVCNELDFLDVRLQAGTPVNSCSKNASTRSRISAAAVVL